MKKEKAIEYIEDYLRYRKCKLPIFDEIAIRLNTPLVISDITFVGLLCIAYDLKPIETEKDK